MKSKMVLYAAAVTILAAVVAPSFNKAQASRESSGSGQTLYVTNNPIGGGGPDSLEYFPANANGNVSPTGNITGSNAQMDGTGYVVVDSSKTVWVTQQSGVSVTGYLAGATGDVVPVTSISGSNTALTSPLGIGIDSANGLYVGNCGSICGGSVDDVNLFPARLNGNVSPPTIITGSNTQLSGASGVWVDNHRNIWVADRGTNSVTEYAAGVNGNSPPICTISGLPADPNGLAVDSAGNVYVRYGEFDIGVWSPGSCGNVPPARQITGSNTGLNLPDGLFVTPNGTLYAANRGGNSIAVYGPGAYGNVSPIRTIAGSNTGLNGPVGVFVK